MKTILTGEDIADAPSSVRDAILSRFEANERTDLAVLYGGLLILGIGFLAFLLSRRSGEAWLLYIPVALGVVVLAIMGLLAWRSVQLRARLEEFADLLGFDICRVSEEVYYNDYLLPKLRKETQKHPANRFVVPDRFPGNRYQRQQRLILKAVIFVVLPVVAGYEFAAEQGAGVGAAFAGILVGLGLFGRGRRWA